MIVEFENFKVRPKVICYVKDIEATEFSEGELIIFAKNNLCVSIAITDYINETLSIRSNEDNINLTDGLLLIARLSAKELNNTLHLSDTLDDGFYDIEHLE